MKIFLIRHGEQEYPYDAQGRKVVSGPHAPLVEVGREQMQQLLQKLDEEGQTLDAIYSSPLLRAIQSAKALAGRRHIPIHVVDGLQEDSPNSAEGHTYEELEKIGGDIYAHPFSPDQETLDHLVERERNAIKFVLSDAKQRGFNSVGIVGHGDPLCALDWSLKHTDNPTSYGEMRDSYYPQKGQALEYNVSDNEPFRITSEGRIITTEAAKQTIEGFRSSGNQEIE